VGKKRVVHKFGQEKSDYWHLYYTDHYPSSRGPNYSDKWSSVTCKRCLAVRKKMEELIFSRIRKKSQENNQRG